MAKTRKNLVSFRKKKKLASRRRKHRGGALCGNPFTITSFQWNRNSCYFDTLLLSLLHAPFPTKEFRKELYNTANPTEDFDDDDAEYSKRWIALHLIYLYDILHGTIEPYEIANRNDVIQKSTEFRNELRDELQKCINKELKSQEGAITKKRQALSQRKLTNYQDPFDLLDWIVKYIEIPPLLTYLDESTGDIVNENYHIVPLEEFGLFAPIDTSHAFGKQLVSVQYGVLPIQIPRFATGQFDSSEIEIPELVQVSGEAYKLQSIIVYLEQLHHYVCYIRCTDQENSWIYYDGLKTKGSMQDSIINDDFDTFISQSVPGSDKNPKEIATQLFYFKV